MFDRVWNTSTLANIHLLKVNNRNSRKGAKYVQN